MRLLGDGGLPGVKPSDVIFASNQVRIRVPHLPSKAWQLDAGRGREADRRGGRHRMSGEARLELPTARLLLRRRRDADASRSRR